MIQPKRIIELGTFTGYSALCLAEGLPEDGELHTVEHHDEDEEELTALFAEYDTRIQLHIGDAAEWIEKLEGPWNLAFIDADKRQYCRYLELLLPKMAPGGFIIADNTLWGGKLLDPESHDAQTEGIRRFNEMVASMSSTLRPVILPLRDGMTIMQVK